MFFLDQTQTYHPNLPLGKVEPNILPLRQIEQQLDIPLRQIEQQFEIPLKQIEQVQQLKIPSQNLNPKVDNELMTVQELINKKRRYLLEKQMYIQHLEKQNKFLRDVRNDYNTYNQYMVKQRQDQILALHILNEYVQDLAISGKLTKTDLDDAKQEQANVLSEINKLKGSLGTIVQGTDDIYYSLRDKMKE